MRGFSRPMIFAPPPPPERPIKRFEALETFRSDETETEYAAGQSYYVWPDNTRLADLAKQWVARGRIKVTERHITSEYIQYRKAIELIRPKPALKERLQGVTHRLRKRIRRGLRAINAI